MLLNFSTHVFYFLTLSLEFHSSPHEVLLLCGWLLHVFTVSILFLWAFVRFQFACSWVFLLNSTILTSWFGVSCSFLNETEKLKKRTLVLSISYNGSAMTFHDPVIPLSCLLNSLIVGEEKLIPAPLDKINKIPMSMVTNFFSYLGTHEKWQ